MPPGYLSEAEILAECQLPIEGLYRTHGSQHIGTIASRMVGAYHGDDEIELGARRSLAVLAVDGLGYRVAAAQLAPDVLAPLTTTFPSTTTTAFLSSLTGSSPSEHGVIGVQYLHPDGRRGYNCITGEITEPSGAGQIRPSPGPAPRTAFTVLRGLGVPTFSLPAELAGVSAAWRASALGGSQVLPGRPAALGAVAAVDAVARDLATALDRSPGGLVWAYVNLDDHLHVRGPDRDIEQACRAIDALARRLSRDGVAVLLYADHGCTASRPGAQAMAAWSEVSAASACRLPAGGAGRVRWLYPRAGEEQRLAGRLRSLLPGAVVTTPAELARWGVVEEGSAGQARLGEIVALARGPDFPVPDAAVAYEHGSLTAEEMLVPMAIWQPAC